MKTSHIAALALIATVATGFNAYAGDTSEFTPQIKETFVSSLSRAQVQADAVQANRSNAARLFSNERGEYLIAAPAQADSQVLTREAVRAELRKSGGSFIATSDSAV